MQHGYHRSMDGWISSIWISYQHGYDIISYQYGYMISYDIYDIISYGYDIIYIISYHMISYHGWISYQHGYHRSYTLSNVRFRLTSELSILLAQSMLQVLPRLFVPCLTGIQLSSHSILLHFKIRSLLTRCCKNSFRETLR